MPYELKELAAISGMPGLFRLLKAARHGVLVESLDAKKARTMAPARNKVSLLADISIYTADYDVTVPLPEVFERIHQHYGQALPVSGKSSEAELRDFMAAVIPDYDQDRVYLSDIKKLATWYGIVSQHVPYQEAAPEAADAADATVTEAAAEAAPATNPRKAKKADEPAADEPLSTGGVIGELEAVETADAPGNPEATPAPAAKKSRKQAE